MPGVIPAEWGHHSRRPVLCAIPAEAGLEGAAGRRGRPAGAWREFETFSLRATRSRTPSTTRCSHAGLDRMSERWLHRWSHRSGGRIRIGLRSGLLPQYQSARIRRRKNGGVFFGTICLFAAHTFWRKRAAGSHDPQSGTSSSSIRNSVRKYRRAAASTRRPGSRRELQEDRLPATWRLVL